MVFPPPEFAAKTILLGLEGMCGVGDWRTFSLPLSGMALIFSDMIFNLKTTDPDRILLFGFRDAHHIRINFEIATLTASALDVARIRDIFVEV